MQGLERDAVVVVHPLVGYLETPTFAIDTGRLCVAPSRHGGEIWQVAGLVNFGKPTVRAVYDETVPGANTSAVN
jgi:hypothetical protein